SPDFLGNPRLARLATEQPIGITVATRPRAGGGVPHGFGTLPCIAEGVFPADGAGLGQGGSTAASAHAPAHPGLPRRRVIGEHNAPDAWLRSGGITIHPFRARRVYDPADTIDPLAARHERIQRAGDADVHSVCQRIHRAPWLWDYDPAPQAHPKRIGAQ